jgi:hypothetical protein
MDSHLVLLDCVECGEQVHVVTFAGNVFASIVCTRCAKTVGPAQAMLLREYAHDFENRLLQKPTKMLKPALHSPMEFFLHYLPHGLIFKPAEILQELETIAHTRR